MKAVFVVREHWDCEGFRLLYVGGSIRAAKIAVNGCNEFADFVDIQEWRGGALFGMHFSRNGKWEFSPYNHSTN